LSKVSARALHGVGPDDRRGVHMLVHVIVDDLAPVLPDCGLSWQPSPPRRCRGYGVHVF
jgi:hypothetical protein